MLAVSPAIGCLLVLQLLSVPKFPPREFLKIVVAIGLSPPPFSVPPRSREPSVARWHVAGVEKRGNLRISDVGPSTETACVNLSMSPVSHDTAKQTSGG